MRMSELSRQLWRTTLVTLSLTPAALLASSCLGADESSSGGDPVPNDGQCSANRYQVIVDYVHDDSHAKRYTDSVTDCREIGYYQEGSLTAAVDPTRRYDPQNPDTIEVQFANTVLVSVDGDLCEQVYFGKAEGCEQLYLCGCCAVEVNPQVGGVSVEGISAFCEERYRASKYTALFDNPNMGCGADWECHANEMCDLATNTCRPAPCVSSGSCATTTCCSGSTCVETPNSVECLKDCTAPQQCDSNCCYPLADGGSVCVPAEYCANCAAPNSECSPTSNPCCPGAACIWVDGVGARCQVQSSECPAGCTNPYGVSCCRPPFCDGDCVGSPCCH